MLNESPKAEVSPELGTDPEKSTLRPKREKKPRKDRDVTPLSDLDAAKKPRGVRKTRPPSRYEAVVTRKKKPSGPASKITSPSRGRIIPRICKLRLT